MLRYTRAPTKVYSPQVQLRFDAEAQQGTRGTYDSPSLCFSLDPSNVLLFFPPFCARCFDFVLSQRARHSVMLINWRETASVCYRAWL